MPKFLIPVGGVVLAVLIVVVLVNADSRLFQEDAEFSSLYQATLQDAYSRFSASDKKVAAGGPVDEFGGAGTPQPMQMAQSLGTRPAAGRQAPGVGTMPAPGQQPAAGQGALNFKQQSEVAALRGAAGGAAPAGTAPAAHQHVHDDGGPHNKRGNELLAQAKYDEAIAEFRLALQENPTRSQAQHSMGDALRYQGKHAEAVAAYEAVLKLKPNFYCCLVHIGEILEAQARSEEAEANYARAVDGYRQELSAGGPQASVAAYHLAKFYLDKNRSLDEAVSLANQAVAAAPNQPVYMHLLARCYERLGRKDDALRIMDQILQLNPENIQVYQMYRSQLLGAPIQPAAAPSVPPAAGGTPPP